MVFKIHWNEVEGGFDMADKREAFARKKTNVPTYQGLLQIDLPPPTTATQ